jgi:hypothetical protein
VYDENLLRGFEWTAINVLVMCGAQTLEDDRASTEILRKKQV